LVNILITGGTGFFGSSLLRLLEADKPQNKSEISVLSRDPTRFQYSQPELANLVEWIKGDILRPQSLSKSSSFSHILHGAADSTSGPLRSPLSRFIQICEGTRNLLDYALVCGATRFLFTSSGAVYGGEGGQPKGVDYQETHRACVDPLRADSAYAMGKLAAEQLCALYAAEHGLEIVIARCFAFIGEDLPLNVHFAIGNFIRDALWSDEIIVNGDGTPIRSYLDQRDLAHWLMTLLRDGKAGEAYNVGSDRAISIADLAHLVRDLVSPEKPVRILGRPVDNAERSRYVPDIRKIHRDLGLRPTYTLEQSILDTAAAARARGRPS
jgi:UDP-glucuronate decarboxylase